jgi:spermidine/putrescine transport system ATP-binding protein
VFQNYALFPHLSVSDNVGFGLRFQKTSRAEADRRIADALKLVRLEGFGSRRPNQLSGGQQQRVALARALILNPSVLLLDEPLGALDAKLRKALQIELKAIQEEVGITFVYVTHDQEEALTMSDRIAVMSEGHIEQTGTPEQIYEEPETAYVADFLGVSNLMQAQADGASRGGCEIHIGDFALVAARGNTSARGPVRVVIRPERVLIHGRDQGPENNCMPGMIQRVVYVGPVKHLMVTLASGETIQAMLPNRGESLTYPQGTPVSVELPANALRVLRESNGRRDASGAGAVPASTPTTAT